MAAPIVYRWDDANAPVLAGAVGYTLVQLLKACLVDGYGVKPAAGWTMPYDNGGVNPTAGVFRNNPITGTGRYLNVTSTNLWYSLVNGYEDMTAYNVGINKFTNTNLYSLEGVAANTTAHPWVLVADDRFFILITWPNIASGSFNPAASCTSSNANSIRVFYFGDGIPFRQDDSNFCIIGSDSSTTYYTCRGIQYGTFASTTNTHIGIARNSAGTFGPFQPSIVNTGLCVGSDHGGTGTGFPLATYGDMFARPYINECAAYTMRGYLPGIWFPGNTPTVYPYISEVTVGDRIFLVLCGYQGSNFAYVASIAIDISDGWRP